MIDPDNVSQAIRPSVAGELEDFISKELAHRNGKKTGWVKTLIVLHDFVAQEFARAEAAGRKPTPSSVVMGFAMYYGGSQLYFPSASAMRKHLRNEEILRRLGKETARDLAREFGLTCTQVYGIAKKHRDMSRQKINTNRNPSL